MRHPYCWKRTGPTVWLAALLILTVLAVAGPFVYLWVEGRAWLTERRERIHLLEHKSDLEEAIAQHAPWIGDDPIIVRELAN